MAESNPKARELQQLLRDHDLPPGLLAGEVVDYSADAETKRFAVTLREPVQVKRGGFPVYYERKLSGRAELGALLELKGIKAKRVVWVSLSSALVEGDEIAFSAGPITTRLPLKEFM